jgi:NitT/TauT family transport system ATP-binding protein
MNKRVSKKASQSGVEIDIVDTSKTYTSLAGEPIVALENLDLKIGSGEFLSIVGPSGCGKSTLLMLVSGLLPLTSGQISIDGETVVEPHAKVGVIFQRDLLLDWRTVIANVLLPVEIKGWDVKEYRPKAEKLLEQVGLEGFAGKYPTELSGGMRQRVSICRALIQEPGLLLMDEPFGALDALTREQISFDVLRMWNDIGNTVLFITHSIDEAVLLSDRVLVMTPRPGKLDLELKIDLPRPRTGQTLSDPKFIKYTQQIRAKFEERGVLKR